MIACIILIVLFVLNDWTNAYVYYSNRTIYLKWLKVVYNGALETVFNRFVFLSYFSLWFEIKVLLKITNHQNKQILTILYFNESWSFWWFVILSETFTSNQSEKYDKNYKLF